MENLYQVKLFYGTQDYGANGIYHAFFAADPDVEEDDEEIGEEMARWLDTTIDSEDYKYNFMFIDLPTSLIEKIKSDGVTEYLENNESV